MPRRLAHPLLVLLLVLGQVGGWLHGLSHHLAPLNALAAEAGMPAGEPGAPDEARGEVCLVCLTVAALAFAVVCGAFVFAAVRGRFARPAGAPDPAFRVAGFARSARGPPRFS